MRISLKGMLARVDRLEVRAHRHDGELNTDRMIAILHEGRRLASLGLLPKQSEEEARYLAFGGFHADLMNAKRPRSPRIEVDESLPYRYSVNPVVFQVLALP